MRVVTRGLAATRKGTSPWRRFPSPAARPGPREILISVAGLTPQVITETLFCLTRLRRPPADVREVWVITTQAGKRKVEQCLLDPGHGRFLQFCRDHRIDPDRCRFSAEQVIAIPRVAGQPVEDIRTAEDSAAAADFILDFVRRHAADPTTILHCSVAGGRKTLGFYLGLALQLYGRSTDTLSHVLVSPPELEGDPGFYYPPAREGWLTAGGRRLHTRDVRVELAEMPLLMLRGKIAALGVPGLSYTELVRRAQEDYALLSAPPRAEIDRNTLRITVAGRRVRLSPLEMAVYLVFAIARQDSCGSPGCEGCRGCTFEAKDFLGGEGLGRLRAILHTLKRSDVRREALHGWGESTSSVTRFREVRSRLNRKIEEGLGSGGFSRLYIVDAVRQEKGDLVRYGIRLDPRLLAIA